MSRNWRGDTIVEVLLAIGIATFGIGMTYATAQRGLEQTITARERNQALNLIENQINNLRLRYQIDPTNFENNFGSPKNHYCFNGTVTTPSPSPPWTPYKNYNGATDYEASNLLSNTTPTSAQPYLAPNCTYKKAGDGVTYFIDIKTTDLTTILPVLSTNPHTLYQIFVRWQPIAGSQINQASQNFKVNGAGTTSLAP